MSTFAASTSDSTNCFSIDLPTMETVLPAVCTCAAAASHDTCSSPGEGGRQEGDSSSSSETTTKTTRSESSSSTCAPASSASCSSSMLENPQGSKEYPKEVTTVNAIIVGPSGAGKSEMICALRNFSDRSFVPTSLSPNFVTQEYIRKVCDLDFEDGQKNKYTVCLYDSRGLGDSDTSFNAIIPQWQRLIVDELGVVNFVFLTIPMDRISLELRDEIGCMLDHFVSWGLKKENLKLILTKTDFTAKVLVDNFIREIVCNEDIHPLIRDNTITPVAFIPSRNMESASSETCPEMRIIRECAEKKLIQSRAGILSMMLQQSPPSWPIRKGYYAKKEADEKKRQEMEEEQEKKEHKEEMEKINSVAKVRKMKEGSLVSSGICSKTSMIILFFALVWILKSFVR